MEEAEVSALNAGCLEDPCLNHRERPEAVDPRRVRCSTEPLGDGAADASEALSAPRQVYRSTPGHDYGHSEDGVWNMILGMAHRGRLNMLVRPD